MATTNASEGSRRRPKGSRNRKGKNPSRRKSEELDMFPKYLKSEKPRAMPKNRQKMADLKKRKEKKRASAHYPEMTDQFDEEAKKLECGRGVLEYKLDFERPAVYVPPTKDSDSERDDFISLDVEPADEHMRQQFALQEQYNNIYYCKWLEMSSTCLSSVNDQITREILQFCEYMSPTNKETQARNACVARLDRICKSVWRGSRVDVFGSYKTGIHLPDADIDVVVMFSDDFRPKNVRNDMYKLKGWLEKNNVADNVEVIRFARVPIVKYIDKRANIPIDVAFDQESGVEGAELVKKWVDTNPALRPLVMVIRQFLRARNYHEVVKGGIGGYSTICLVYTLLMRHPIFSGSPKLAVQNLGLLLIEFFDFYGNKFQNSVYAIRTTPNFNPFLRRTMGSMQTPEPNGISIQDPVNRENNVSKSSYNYPALKKCFSLTALCLKAKCVEWTKLPSTQKPSMSFLAPVLMINPNTKPRPVHELKQNYEEVSEADLEASKQALARQRELNLAARESANEDGDSNSKQLQPTSAEGESKPDPKETPQTNTNGTSTATVTPTTAPTPPQNQKNSHQNEGSNKSQTDTQGENAPLKLANAEQDPGFKVFMDSVLSPGDSDAEDSRTSISSAKRRKFWSEKSGVTLPSTNTNDSDQSS